MEICIISYHVAPLLTTSAYTQSLYSIIAYTKKLIKKNDNSDNTVLYVDCWSS